MWKKIVYSTKEFLKYLSIKIKVIYNNKLIIRPLVAVFFPLSRKFFINVAISTFQSPTTKRFYFIESETRNRKEDSQWLLKFTLCKQFFFLFPISKFCGIPECYQLVCFDCVIWKSSVVICYLPHPFLFQFA